MPAEWSWGSCPKNSIGKCGKSGRCGQKKVQQQSKCSSQQSGKGEDRQEELRQFWAGLSHSERRKILRVEKKELFRKIRCLYCSRCYGLFQLRYEELKGAPPLDCPTCKECYSSLVVGKDGALRLQEDVIMSDPFQKFQDAKNRERERELQFMTGNICGSGWVKKPGQNMCSLHTTPVPCEALAEYWSNLPEEHRSALFCLADEDFVGDLDAHLKYQLKICRDCRGNVMRAFKDLKAGKDGPESEMTLCKDHLLKVGEGVVRVDGPGGAHFFEKAEEVEENKVPEGLYDTDLAHSDDIRHAETPALAQEALQECSLLIFKSQAEVAFREQSAGHNALLLFVHLTLQIMEQNLINAFKELGVKQAEAELLELLAVEQNPAKKSAKKSKSKKKKTSKTVPQSSSSLSSASSSLSPSPPPEVHAPEVLLDGGSEAQEELDNSSKTLIHSEPDQAQIPKAEDSLIKIETPMEKAGGSPPSHREKFWAKAGDSECGNSSWEWKIQGGGNRRKVQGRSIEANGEQEEERTVDMSLEDWPTPEESKSILQSIKVPSPPSGESGMEGFSKKVALETVHGESTPPGDFRIHALTDFQKLDAREVGLEKVEEISDQGSKKSRESGPHDMGGGQQNAGNGRSSEDGFSLFHIFPGDYTLVYGPPRKENASLGISLPKPMEFNRFYTPFGHSPLVSVFDPSLVSFAQTFN